MIELFIIWNTYHDNNSLNCCNGVNRSLFTINSECIQLRVASNKKSVLHIINNIKRYLIFANINLHFTTTNIITSPQHTLYRHHTYQSDSPRETNR